MDWIEFHELQVSILAGQGQLSALLPWQNGTPGSIPGPKPGLDLERLFWVFPWGSGKTGQQAAHTHHHSGALTSFTKTQWLSLEARLVSTACRKNKNVHEQKQGRSWQTHKMMTGMTFYKHCFCRIFSSQNNSIPLRPTLAALATRETHLNINIWFSLSFHALLQWPRARLEALDSPTGTTDHRYSQSLPTPRMHANSFPRGHLRIASSLHKTTELENWYSRFMAARPKLQSSFAFSLGSTELGSFQLLRTRSNPVTLSALFCYSTCHCCVWKVTTVLFVSIIYFLCQVGTRWGQD